jgi:dolichyl-phosphate-mannose--protein O-mannosyl transferase
MDVRVRVGCLSSPDALRSPCEREYGVVGRYALIDSPLLCFQGASVRPTFTLHVYVRYAR